MKHEKKWKWKPTLFSICVLCLVIGAILGFFSKEENPLLNEKNAITLYMEIEAGEEPEFKTERFFSEKEVEYDLVSYDTSGCDFDTPGVIEIPVLYEGKTSNCVVQLTIRGTETEAIQETSGAEEAAGDEKGQVSEETGTGQSLSAAE